jgi:hypothetical protein
MKKFLFFFSLITVVIPAKSQTAVFNEFYTDPGAGKSEFFEIYNTSTGNVAENLDCYRLVTWFKDGSTTGFYVLDFPNLNVAPKSFFVGAASDPFNVQAQTNVDAAFSWNNFADATGSLTFYERSGSGYLAGVTPPAGFNDLFHTATGSGATYAMFLFKNNTYINGFLGGYNSTTVEAAITSMPTLTAATNCGNLVVNWASITLAEQTTANGGSDNGFIRDKDGKCGSWKKSSSQVQHTPGASNGAATGTTGALVTAEFFGSCPTQPGVKSILNYSITGFSGDATEGNTFPIEIQLYYDYAPFANATTGLGAEDIYQRSHTQTLLSDPQDTFQVFPQNQRVVLVYKTVLGCFDKVVAITNACSSLPANFRSFTATRSNRTNVFLKWETITEQNSASFVVERNINGSWEPIANIPSQAIGGSSNSLLTYQLNDLNAAKGISQYRIRQIDFDGAAKISDIRSVRGEGQKGSTIVYPNPSSDGKVNVVFEGGIAKRNITVQDMSGRVIKEWRSYTNNNIQIENLTPGFYTIRIVNIETGEQDVEKAVVNKR